MMKWFLRRWIDKFERTWSYDAGYLRDILDADPRALQAFGKVTGIGTYRKDVPPEVHCAVGIVAVMTEDCGPCTQLGIDMAQRAGVDPAVLRAVVARDFHAMPPDVALAVRFAEASLRHAPEADELREEVLRRFGKRAAALNPIYGAEKILRFLACIARKNPALPTTEVRAATINGLAGYVLREQDGAIDTMAFEHRAGRIVAIYVIRNPDKLRHVRF
jgi:hypothetical protein